MSKKTAVLFLTIIIIALPILSFFTIADASDEETNNRTRFQGDIELMADKLTQDVVPNLEGDKAEGVYKIFLTNRGEEADQFDITQSNNHDFEISIEPIRTGKLEPESYQEVTITIKVDNRASISDMDYNTTIKAISISNHSRFNTISLKTKVLQAYGVELQPYQNKQKTQDEINKNYRRVTFQSNILNIGTGYDSFKLDAGEINGPHIDWVSFSNLYHNLESNENITFYIYIDVPKDCVIGYYDFQIRATSRGDDTSYDISKDAIDLISIEVEVTQLFDINLSSSNTFNSGMPGDLVEFTFKVTNKGNGEDIIELRMMDYDLDWPWEFDVSRFTLQSKSNPHNKYEQEIKLSVIIPRGSNASAGNHSISILVYSIDTPTGNLVQNNNQPLIFIVMVKPVYEVEIAIDYPDSYSGEVEPGKKLNYYFTVINYGNSMDTFIFQIFGEKVEWITPLEREFTLMPNKAEKINITINIPALNDNNALEIEAKRYDFKAVVSSKNDPLIFDEIYFRSEVSEVFWLEFESDLQKVSKTHDNFDVDPNVHDDNNHFILTVINKGNSRDEVTLQSKKMDDWSIRFINQYSKTIYLNIGDSAEIEIRVIPPDSTTNGETKIITIQARSDNNIITAEYSFNVTVRTSIIEFEDLKIIGDKVPGENVYIKLTVKNTGDADAEDVDITFYDRDQRIIHKKTIKHLKANNETDIKFGYDLEEGDYIITAETEWSDNTIEETEEFTSKPPDISWTVSLGIILVMIILAILIISIMIFTKRKNLQQQKLEAEAAKRAQKEGGEQPPKISGAAKAGSHLYKGKPSSDKNWEPKEPLNQEQYPYQYYPYYYPPPDAGYYKKQKFQPRYPPY